MPVGLAEDRQVELFARPEPDHMRRVVGETVTGIGMGENGEWPAVENQPFGKVAEQPCRNG